MLVRKRARELEAKLDLAQERPALSWLKNRNARWVRPELSVKVKHLGGGRSLRHAIVREITG
jgi:hypothetical protein